ncbi:MAG: Unknown protein [uncultured Thiotrichaceae bacterium]|uniref:DUF58 domain-containing protein n=1 Tax=uncultured Thiotrichaceae bacterium TaxID=298394 RepID=A0A6S6TUY8_9GAMM|nr:MAG: Unknown protein [uncultured Thiotrichaceae bacterium]
MKLTEQPLLQEQELHVLYERAKLAGLSYSQRLLKQPQYGDTLSRFRGSGMDYEDSRSYEPGDEPRFFNWRLMARTGKAHVKVFREERRPSVFIMLDRRVSMRFGTRKRLKITQANRMAALIAFAALHQGWSVAGVLLDEQVQWFPASQEEANIWHFLEQASQAAPPQERHTSVDMQAVLAELPEYVLPGMHIYLLSDFMQDAQQDYVNLVPLVKDNPLLAVQIVDAAECELSGLGTLELQGMCGEGADKLSTVNTADESLRKEFRHAANHYRQDIERQFAKYGVNYYQLKAEDDKPEDTVPLPQAGVE